MRRGRKTAAGNPAGEPPPGLQPPALEHQRSGRRDGTGLAARWGRGRHVVPATCLGTPTDVVAVGRGGGGSPRQREGVASAASRRRNLPGQQANRAAADAMRRRRAPAPRGRVRRSPPSSPRRGPAGLGRPACATAWMAGRPPALRGAGPPYCWRRSSMAASRTPSPRGGRGEALPALACDDGLGGGDCAPRSSPPRIMRLHTARHREPVPGTGCQPSSTATGALRVRRGAGWRRAVRRVLEPERNESDGV
jgi:hypothetical protein